MNEIEAIKHSQRYFDCKVCGRHMTRMIDPDGRPWIQVDRTLPEGGLDFHTSGVYCPNCIPRSMEAGWKRAMSLRASRVANAELMGGEGVPCSSLVRHCMKCGQIKQHSSPSACVCKSCVLEQECDLGVQRIIRDIESPNPSRLGAAHLVRGTQHGVVQCPNQEESK